MRTVVSRANIETPTEPFGGVNFSAFDKKVVEYLREPLPISDHVGVSRVHRDAYLAIRCHWERSRDGFVDELRHTHKVFLERYAGSGPLRRRCARRSRHPVDQSAAKIPPSEYGSLKWLQSCTSRIVSRARARNGRIHVLGLTGSGVGRNPFVTSAPAAGSPAIMPRVADATRMTVLGFGMDDAKLL